jgi:tetratricopeptide (TPR) repeat protein
MAAMAFIAFVALLLLWFFGLPGLAVYYSNHGLDELLAGRVTTAQRNFQRAVALNPDQVVAYQNLADVYARIGQPDEAINWYKQAIAHDLNFGPAYARLSQTYNEQGKFEQAAQIALAGLRPENKTRQADVALAAEYDLLANLGWAYFEQEKYDQAQEALEAALALEPQLKPLEATRGQLRRALPHYYLAQIYEQRNKSEEALVQWRETLRFLNADNWGHQEWLAVVQAKLSQP